MLRIAPAEVSGLSGGFSFHQAASSAPPKLPLHAGLPIKAGLVGNAPASPIHVEAGAFALLPHRVERHAADAL